MTMHWSSLRDNFQVIFLLEAENEIFDIQSFSSCAVKSTLIYSIFRLMVLYIAAEIAKTQHAELHHMMVTHEDKQPHSLKCFFYDSMTDTDIKHSHHCVSTEQSLSIHFRRVLLISHIVTNTTATGLHGQATTPVTTMTYPWLTLPSTQSNSTSFVLIKNKSQKPSKYAGHSI